MNRRSDICIFGLAAFIILLFFSLGVRLYQLQVVDGAAMSGLSRSNSVRLLTLPAPRGQIESADGQLLAGNRLVFVISVMLTDAVQPQELAPKLAVALQDPSLDAAAIESLLNAHSRRYEPCEIARYDYQAGLAAVSRVEEQRAELPGVLVTEQAQRSYPQGSLAGHLLGHVGAITAEELEQYEVMNYQATDQLGKSGLEKTLESWQEQELTLGLRGQAGIGQVEVTASHRKARDIYRREPVAGHTVRLTLNAALQQALEDSLAQTIARVAERHPKCRAGAAVLLEVKTGAVLAMASYPNFDPNDFAGGLSAARAAYYADGDLSPSLNRAISAHYPPGSVFKPVTALAILQSGINPSETVLCTPAAWPAGSGRARCTGSHGTVDLRRAMARSCNTYFQEMGARAGIDAIEQAALSLGLGAKSGLNLPGEVSGTVPGMAWKAEHFMGWEQDWHNYDTFYTAMGQGYTTVTPLQLALAAAAIANDGTRMRPYVVQEVRDYEGTLLFQATPQAAEQIEAPDGAFAVLKEAMLGVTGAGGTGYGVFASLPLTAAGKSGTAQTGRPGDDNDHHGLFIAFAPYDDPEVAVACVIEYGYSGSGSAAYVCRDVLAAYFGL